MSQLFSILAAGGTDPVTNKTLLSRERIDDFMDAAPPLIDRVIGIPASFGKGMWVSDELLVSLEKVFHSTISDNLYADFIQR